MCGSAMLTTVASGIVTCANRSPMAQCQEAIAPWERPELGPWLTDPVKLVQYDGIVAYDVSRLSREYFDLAWLRKWAEANHKKLYVIKERLHWPDNRDGTLWGVAAERAYEERQDIIERVTRELEALREAGKLAIRVPFGYTSAGDKYHRYLIPTDEGRTYIPLIYQHCIDGWSMKTIAEWLTDEGVKPSSGEKWWGAVVGRIIKNPTYMGHQCQRDLVPPDEVEESDGKARPLPLRQRLDRDPALSVREDHPPLRTPSRCRHMEARERGTSRPLQAGPRRSSEPCHAR